MPSGTAQPIEVLETHQFCLQETREPNKKACWASWTTKNSQLVSTSCNLHTEDTHSITAGARSTLGNTQSIRIAIVSRTQILTQENKRGVMLDTGVGKTPDLAQVKIENLQKVSDEYSNQKRKKTTEITPLLTTH